mgnify:CR=1 FL=1
MKPRFNHHLRLIRFLRKLGVIRRKIYMAEIGVWEGETSEVLLTRFPKLHITMVDSWRNIPRGADFREKRDMLTKKTQPEFDRAFSMAMERIGFARERVRVVREFSVDAAQKLHRSRFNLVFIDAGHDYLSVKNDINAWYPLVKYGGILCGHDYGSKFFE